MTQSLAYFLIWIDGHSRKRGAEMGSQTLVHKFYEISLKLMNFKFDWDFFSCFGLISVSLGLFFCSAMSDTKMVTVIELKLSCLRPMTIPWELQTYKNASFAVFVMTPSNAGCYQAWSEA